MKQQPVFTQNSKKNLAGESPALLNPKTTTMKNNQEFKMLTTRNEVATLEYETTINGELCSVFYFKDRDEVLILIWCDWHEDELKFIRTSNFDSFRDWIESDEKLISYTDHWNYQNDSIFQEYQKQDFDEWVYYEGEDELKTFVEDQLKTHGIEYVKRSLNNRLKRWSEKTIFKIKSLLK